MTRQSVAVAVATFQRPHGLEQLLLSLAASIVDRPFTVVVVDNDPKGSAAALLDDLRPVLPFALVTAHEPEPGISAARNRALHEAAGHDLVCFVDDDERVDPAWLQTLLDVRDEYDADGVTGPVEYDFEITPPGWATLGSFYTEPGFDDGDECHIAGTNNLLLDMASLSERDLRFDSAFGLTGGSDIVLTRRLTDTGGTIVWAQNAIVRETVPAVRCRRPWLVTRAIRGGNSFALMQLGRSGTRRASRLGTAAGGLLRILAGAGLIVSAPRISTNRRGARGFRTLLRGIGVLGAALDLRVHEYARR